MRHLIPVNTILRVQTNLWSVWIRQKDTDWWMLMEYKSTGNDIHAGNSNHLSQSERTTRLHLLMWLSWQLYSNAKWLFALCFQSCWIYRVIFFFWNWTNLTSEERSKRITRIQEWQVAAMFSTYQRFMTPPFFQNNSFLVSSVIAMEAEQTSKVWRSSDD